MRDPATAPSGMTSRGIAIADKRRARAAVVRDLAFWAFVPWILVSLILTLLIVFLPGCTSSTAKTEADVIHEADVLLRDHAHPELPEWEKRRLMFLAAEKQFVAPSPSPTAAPRCEPQDDNMISTDEFMRRYGGK